MYIMCVPQFSTFYRVLEAKFKGTQISESMVKTRNSEIWYNIETNLQI